MKNNILAVCVALVVGIVAGAFLAGAVGKPTPPKPRGESAVIRPIQDGKHETNRLTVERAIGSGGRYDSGKLVVSHDGVDTAGAWMVVVDGVTYIATPTTNP